MSTVLHRDLRRDPPRAVRGEGMFLFSQDGRRIIDGSGGAAVACLGHGDPRVKAAILDQLDRVAYAHTSFFSNDAAEALADLLVGHRPGGLTHAFFVSSGSEAMESAIKLARQYFVEIGQSQRTRFIARRSSYHGNTLGALAASGNVARREPFLPLLSDAFSHVSPCFAYRGQDDGESDETYVARLAAELEAEFQRLGPQNVAAFCAETVVGATLGCVAAAPGYFQAIRAVCDRHGALLILDEVMSGMGRCGSLHAWEQEGVTPDIQTIAKGLSGGYQPIGGVLIQGRIVDALRDGRGYFQHGHTYQAHPVACAAALAVQRIIHDEGLVAHAAAMGVRLRDGLMATLGQHPHVGDIRGRGLFWAVELVADRDTKRPFARTRGVNTAIAEAAFSDGLAVYAMAGTVDGYAGDHVLIAPPYIAQPADIDAIVERFAGSVTRTLAGA